MEQSAVTVCLIYLIIILKITLNSTHCIVLEQYIAQNKFALSSFDACSTSLRHLIWKTATCRSMFSTLAERQRGLRGRLPPGPGPNIFLT